MRFGVTIVAVSVGVPSFTDDRGNSWRFLTFYISQLEYDSRLGVSRARQNTKTA